MTGDYQREVRFEIVERLGVLASHSTGWRKELNIIRWNGGLPKFDIRDWSPDHEHMSRGITLHMKEGKHAAMLILSHLGEDEEKGFDTEGGENDV